MPDPVLAPPKPFNEKDPNPCSGCSYCCEYIALEIDRPTTVKEFDEILWYLLHKDVWIYVTEARDWFIQFNTPCEKLDNQRCSYYPHRPMMCRNYEPSGCDRYGEGEPEETHLFKNEIDFFAYLEKKRPAIFRKLKEKLSA